MPDEKTCRFIWRDVSIITVNCVELSLFHSRNQILYKCTVYNLDNAAEILTNFIAAITYALTDSDMSLMIVIGSKILIIILIIIKINN